MQISKQTMDEIRPLYRKYRDMISKALHCADYGMYREELNCLKQAKALRSMLNKEIIFLEGEAK